MVARLVLMALAAPLASNAAMLRQQQAAMLGGPNPIRKVVNLLTALQQKVAEEGKAEEKLFDKYQCYCKTSAEGLSASIDQGKNQIQQQETTGGEAGNKLTQVEADLKAHKASREEAKDTISQATALREKAAAAFAAEATESKNNLAALGKAIDAIGRGSSGSFLQTKASVVLRRFAMEKAEIADDARQEILSFLSGSSSDGYAPQSGEVVGILKQLKDSIETNAAAAAAAEETAAESFHGLIAAKKKELESLQEQIESEQLRIGELSVLGASSAHDLEAVKAALVENEKFLAELQETCASKAKEWEEIKKARGEELVAIAETVKVLNDDENLDLFKKTLPSSTSFLQVQVSASALKAQALATIRAAADRTSIAHPQLELIALALSGKKVGFDKVVGMIDDLVANLQKEQQDDDDKKTYCQEQFDSSEDSKKELELAVSDSEAAIEETEGNIEKLRSETKELEEGIKALDASVSEATTQRQAEHTDHVELLTNNAAAKDVLLWAKNRLNKFYNPKLYKERFAQVSARSYNGGTEAPPEFPGAHAKKSEESGGVIQLIDALIADLDKEIQTSEVDEKRAQASYEKLLEQARNKRAKDSQAITEKESSVAALEEGLQAEKDTKSGSEKELAATEDYIHNLHNECDWLLQYFDTRKEAREGEIDSLGKAKAVLSGADFSLVQTGRSHHAFLASRRA